MQKKQNNKPSTKVSKQIVQYKAPVAVTKVKRNVLPKIKPIGQDFRIKHREFVRDIVGSVAFSSAQTVAINPGLVLTFPWLSAIARRFESYRFNSLAFRFETTAPTSATGTALLTLDYDPTDLSPISKTQALSYKSAVRTAPWQEACLTCSSEDLHKRSSYFVRGAPVVTTDLHLYDVGNLYMCVSGQASTASIGELYVEYDVTLMTPQLESTDPLSLSAVGGGVINKDASPFGTTETYKGGLPIVVAGTLGLTTIQFLAPADYFLVWLAVGTGVIEPTFTGTNMTFTKVSNNIAGTTTLTYVARISVVDATNSYVTVDTTGWTTATSSKLLFTRCVYSDMAV